MSSQLNCPNCGAPITGDKCEYCGTHFMDCTMDTERPFYIKLRNRNGLYVDRVYLRNATIESSIDAALQYRLELTSLGLPSTFVVKTALGE